MVEKNMITLTERTIMKSRSGVYSDTSENRRKHRVGQKYGAEKQPEDDEKTEKKETDPEKELEAVNKVIAAINEGKLNLPAAEVMKLSEKKQKLEAAMKQAEKINAGVKANEEKINEAQKKEEGSEKAPEGVSQQSYDSITKKARATQLGYTLNIDGKDVRVERTIETSGGQRTPVYQIHGMEKKYWDLDKMISDYRKNNDAGKGKSDNDKEEVKETNKKIDEASKKKKYGDMNVEEAKKELLGKDLTITDIETGKTRTEKITSILIGSVRGHETVMARVEGGGTYPIKQINTGKAWKAWKLSLASETKEPEKKEESSSKKYSEMDIKEARKELLGKKITFKEYFFDGVDSYKDAVGEIKQVRLYGKEKQPVLSADFPNGDSVQISLKQLDERKALKYEIGFNENVGEEKTEKKEKSEQKPSDKAPEADEDDLREARRKLSYLQDNEERLIKRDGKEKYEERLKQAKDEVSKLKGEKPKESQKSEYFDRTGYKPIYRMNEEEADKFISDAKKYLSENKDAKDVEQVQDAIRKVELRKEEIKETSNEEAEVYTRIKFEDVPNSGKINLKKYLSEKVRKGVDEKWSNIKNIPTENLKKMEKGLVNDLNKNFEAIKKSQRAELLYSIMKVKGELEKRGKESQKKE